MGGVAGRGILSAENVTFISIAANGYFQIEIIASSLVRSGVARRFPHQAILRMLTSGDTTANGGTITIKGTALESPSDAVAGGGSNTSIVVAIPGGFLAPGASVNVRYLLGVAQGGTFRFFVNVEALP